MKYIRKCPFLVAISFTVLLYLIGYDLPRQFKAAWEFLSANQREQQVAVVNLPEVDLPLQNELPSDGVSGNSVSNNSVSGNSVSGNSVSGNSVSGNSVSGNSVSGNSVSANGTTENSVSENVIAEDYPWNSEVSDGDLSENQIEAGSLNGKKPRFVEVDDSYFNDALFIGDSRTIGLLEYGEMEQATFYAATGLTIHKIFDTPIVEQEGSKKRITIEEALQQRSFGKIYLMIGINELGTGTDKSFAETYGEVIQRIRQLQPNAIIYIEAIMKVTTSRSEKGDYINNETIMSRNRGIRKLINNKDIFYLDVNPSISDNKGGMKEEYTFDGVHLKAEYTYLWKDFLYKNGIKYY